MQETWVQSLGREDPLEKAMAPHSSTLAWKIPWTEKPGKLQSMRSQRVGIRLSNLIHFLAPNNTHLCRLLCIQSFPHFWLVLGEKCALKRWCRFGPEPAVLSGSQETGWQEAEQLKEKVANFVQNHCLSSKNDYQSIHVSQDGNLSLHLKVRFRVKKVSHLYSIFFLSVLLLWDHNVKVDQGVLTAS